MSFRTNVPARTNMIRNISFFPSLKCCRSVFFQLGSPAQSRTELSGLQIRRITTNASGDFITGLEQPQVPHCVQTNEPPWLYLFIHNIIRGRNTHCEPRGPRRGIQNNLCGLFASRSLLIRARDLFKETTRCTQTRQKDPHHNTPNSLSTSTTFAKS